ncbi:MAG: glycosyltransferase family 2 protein [Leptolyngbyaceae cyanobacterium SM1_4_3]|nr:glycosyltransferase family 2 protein [Leptolyngbyaceae cyanobacterium SM1_4_3]NJN89899.1 glycosyltransferase family 2 protein [Leptolyngbyaceae cyanobacterium SL_5_14]
MKHSQNSVPSPKISIIIPVLNEANVIQQILNQLRNAAVEIIVVDGGSQDQTVEIVKSLGDRVIHSRPGRAYQMNAGAKAATGEILLFLHADTRLPTGFADLICQTLAQPKTIAGAFALEIDGPQPGLRLVEWGVNVRSRYFQMPYGDQALFLRAETFARFGGFPELPFMEDFELVRRLRRKGKVAIAPASVLTSARRWKKLGVLRTTLLNQVIIAAYLIGVSPEKIVKWYRGDRRKC